MPKAGLKRTKESTLTSAPTSAPDFSFLETFIPAPESPIALVPRQSGGLIRDSAWRLQKTTNVARRQQEVKVNDSL
jgi:hypothetical protein